MSTYEKVFNIMMKIIGIIWLVEVFVYWFNIYQPSKFTISIAMLVTGLFFTFAEFTKPTN